MSLKEMKFNFSNLKKIENVKEDSEDYNSAIKVKMTNKDWTSHKDLKRKLGIK